jgi:hypothetical protein
MYQFVFNVNKNSSWNKIIFLILLLVFLKEEDGAILEKDPVPHLDVPNIFFMTISNL